MRYITTTAAANEEKKTQPEILPTNLEWENFVFLIIYSKKKIIREDLLFLSNKELQWRKNIRKTIF